MVLRVPDLQNPWIFIYLSIVFLTIAVSFIVFAVYIIISGECWVNSLKNQLFPENLNSYNQDHDAFVVIHSMGCFNFIRYSGFDILIKFFTSHRYPFKIYHCYKSEDFITVLKNENTKYIWIFGHGWRGGITFGGTRTLSHLFTPNITSFSYKKIQDEWEKYPKKKFIGQFHCNNIAKSIPENISLPEILLEMSNDSKYYVSNCRMNSTSIWFAVRGLLNELKRTEVPIAIIDNNQYTAGCSIL